MDGQIKVEDWGASEQLLDLFQRLRKVAFEQHPLRNGEISMPQLTLLDWVAASPGTGISEIAAGLKLSAPTVSVTVSQMEEAGLLERRPNPEDARALKVHLTEKGSELQQRAYNFRLDKMGRLLSGLEIEEAKQMLELLDKAIRYTEQDATS